MVVVSSELPFVIFFATISVKMKIFFCLTQRVFDKSSSFKGGITPEPVVNPPDLYTHPGKSKYKKSQYHKANFVNKFN